MKTEINWEQKASDAIDAISDKIGAGADHFYPILVKQQMIEGAVPVAVFVFFIVLSLGVSRLRPFFIKREIVELFWAIVGLSAFGTAISFAVACTHISKLLNPEYHALREIINMFK